MTTIDEARAATPAEALGMTAEIGRAIAAVANGELQAGRLDTAREILEGLAISNPYDPVTWAMLAVVERRRGSRLVARLCAETAYRLAPGDDSVRLVRAEAMLCAPSERSRAADELRALRSAPEPIAARARALLTALAA